MASGYFPIDELYDNAAPPMDALPGPESALAGLDVVRIPGAVERLGGAGAPRLRLWLSNSYNRTEAELLARAVPHVAINRKGDLPWRLKAHLVLVMRRNSAANGDGKRWKLLSRCDLTDFFRVWAGPNQTGPEWRHLIAGGTVPRFRPDNGETLRDVQDRVIFFGQALAPIVGGGEGEVEAETGTSDGIIP